MVELLPAFLAGLMGSVHCIGMCGGIVGAFSAAPGARRVVPIASASTSTIVWPLAYNAGRISSYAAAGAAFGLAGAALAGGAGLAAGTTSARGALSALAAITPFAHALAAVLLLATGAYLAGALPVFAAIERAGRPVWQRLRPALSHVLPMDRPWKAVAAGALWGFVPCGMVYSMLVLALLTGSALQGAAVMAAFGLGTLPLMLALGSSGAALLRSPRARALAGLVVAGFGVAGLLRVATGAANATWLPLCVSP